MKEKDQDFENFESSLRREEIIYSEIERDIKNSEQQKIDEAIEKIKKEFQEKKDIQEKKYFKDNELIALQYLSILEKEFDRLLSLSQQEKNDIDLMKISKRISNLFSYIGFFPKAHCSDYQRSLSSLQKRIEKLWREREDKWKKNLKKEYYEYRPWFIFLGDTKHVLFI